MNPTAPPRNCSQPGSRGSSGLWSHVALAAARLAAHLPGDPLPATGPHGGPTGEEGSLWADGPRKSEVFKRDLGFLPGGLKLEEAVGVFLINLGTHMQTHRWKVPVSGSMHVRMFFLNYTTCSSTHMPAWTDLLRMIIHSDGVPGLSGWFWCFWGGQICFSPGRPHSALSTASSFAQIRPLFRLTALPWVS